MNSSENNLHDLEISLIYICTEKEVQKQYYWNQLDNQK